MKKAVFSHLIKKPEKNVYRTENTLMNYLNTFSEEPKRKKINLSIMLILFD